MEKSIRGLAEQYRTEAVHLDRMITTLRTDSAAADSEVRKRIDILCSMRRENLSTYRHLLGYCAAVERRRLH